MRCGLAPSIPATPSTQEMDLWRIRPSGGHPERLTQRNADIRDPTPLGRRRSYMLHATATAPGHGCGRSITVSKSSRRLTFGLERYTSLSASVDGKRLAATVANPKAGLWTVPILDSVAQEGDESFLTALLAVINTTLSWERFVLFVVTRQLGWFVEIRRRQVDRNLARDTRWNTASPRDLA